MLQYYYNKNCNPCEEISFDERLKFYLGDLFHENEIKINKDKLQTVCDNILDYSSYFEGRIFINRPSIQNMRNVVIIWTNEIKKILEKHNYLDKYFKMTVGDIHFEIKTYSFTKDRFDSNKGVILKCWDMDRHWGPLYDLANIKEFNRTNFSDRESKIFWRGTTTGQENRPGNRFTLMKNWFDKYDYIDVGFSFICQGKSDYKEYVKGTCGIDYFINHKYLLSIEGNDKDSGLNWKLFSNSLVMMPKPRAVSWLMESKLIPDYHYILLKDDFSDLKEKYEWCEKNQERCEQIIKNANDYMLQFFDMKKEDKLEKDLLETYFSKVIPE